MDDLPEEDEKIQNLKYRVRELNQIAEGVGDRARRALSAASPVSGLGPTGWSLPDGPDHDRVVASSNYKKFEGEARPLVAKYLPEQIEEFDGNSKEILDILNLRVDPPMDESDKNEYAMRVSSLHGQQIATVSAIPGRVRSERLVNPRHITAKFARDEIQKARNMEQEGHLRAAGVIAGVALEEQLTALCKSASVDFKADDGLTALSQKLNEAGEIDDDEHRLIKYLAGVRNKCAHFDGEHEPDILEIQRLINEADNLIKNYSGP